ncbi:MAG: GNAT family N-acetyltransferase [Thermoplasmata archaeon]|nr:GNAT family N-acetyltransferase [Thermoplasmata archaeon]
MDELEIRSLTTDDLDEYNALLRYAFQVTEADLMRAGWRDDDIEQSKFPVLERADVLGCWDGDQLVSQIAVYPLRMNIHSAVYNVGHITSVSTYPEYSGRGIMKRILRLSLERMREDGRSLAMLYPFSIPLYRRFGWEIVSNKISYKVKDTQIFRLGRKDRAPGYVRRVEWDDPGFMDLHARFALRTHGCILRDRVAWEEYWRWDEEDTIVAVYYDTSDTPTGYMVYLIKEDVMHVKEMVYLNMEAQKGLWDYISAHYSMIDEVRGNTYRNELMAFILEDGNVTEAIRPYMMGRIVDVGMFFRDYLIDDAEADVCFAFEVTDSFLEWNNATFNVLFHGGKAEVTTMEPDYTVKLSIGTLTTMLMGYMTATQLHRLERIEGSDEAIEALDEILIHEIPYISDYI